LKGYHKSITLIKTGEVRMGELRVISRTVEDRGYAASIGTTADD